MDDIRVLIRKDLVANGSQRSVKLAASCSNGTRRRPKHH